uniref:LEM3-like protein n=1 Tax=Coccidioides posadasii RMSCC 3488 TaxID=454284 RepID=A0A0J6F3W0_COCPO|nr:LEM3-like protein [Coccidioides posadasii RMSCC 3488]
MSQTVTRADSVEEQDPHNSREDKKPKSRRPANTAFRQQRLKAWQPILTPKTVLPLFFAVGIIFAPIGGLLIWASSQVEEIVIDYSKCETDAPLGSGNARSIPEENVRASFRSQKPIAQLQWYRTENQAVQLHSGVVKNDTTVCSLIFEIPNDIGPPVYFYYRLDKFYQNHRRYVKSLDLEQLKGKALSNGTIGSSACDPLRLNPDGKAYYPCGLIANSLFNDTFSSPVKVGTSPNETFEMTNQGISWASDRELYGPTEYSYDQVVPPPNWKEMYPDDYTEDYPPPNLREWEEFQVWMRTAGLPTFSKLARRADNKTMTAGLYRIDINYYFPVLKYDGKKSIVLTTTTVMGGKNPFMGIAYVVVGGLCIVLGALFTLAHLIKPRKLGDHRYLTWNNEQSPTAMTTGRDAGFGG